MKLLLILAAALVAAAQQQDEEFELQLVERGLVLRERVRLLGDDLELLEVPRHHELQHVSVALDFRANTSLTVYHAEGFCHLSSLPAGLPRPSQQRRGLQLSKHFVHYAGSAQEVSLINIRSGSPLKDVSSIRPEARELCRGLPVYRTRTFQLPHNVQEETFLVPDPQGAAALSHRTRRQNGFFCPIEKFYQKCAKKSSRKGCYYVVQCQDIEVGKPNPRCVEHLRDINVECVPCCKDPNTPDDGFIRSCARTTVGRTANCQRTFETPCRKFGDNCARTFSERCEGQEFASVEACGDWECN